MFNFETCPQCIPTHEIMLSLKSHNSKTCFQNHHNDGQVTSNVSPTTNLPNLSSKRDIQCHKNEFFTNMRICIVQRHSKKIFGQVLRNSQNYNSVRKCLLVAAAKFLVGLGTLYHWWKHYQFYYELPSDTRNFHNSLNNK